MFKFDNFGGVLFVSMGLIGLLYQASSMLEPGLEKLGASTRTQEHPLGGSTNRPLVGTEC